MRYDIYRVADMFPRALIHLRNMGKKLTLKGVLTVAYRRKVGKKAGGFDFAAIVTVACCEPAARSHCAPKLRP